MRTLSLQKKLFYFISIISIGVVVIGIFVIVPVMKNINDLKQNIVVTEKFLEDRFTRMQHLQRSVRELDEIASQTQKFDDITIIQGKELEAITQLERIASDHHIEQNLDVDFVESTKNKENLSSRPYYRFSFTNHGFFVDHVSYFQALEKLPFYMIIKSIQWEKRASGPDQPTAPLTVKFDAIIYAASS